MKRGCKTCLGNTGGWHDPLESAQLLQIGVKAPSLSKSCRLPVPAYCICARMKNSTFFAIPLNVLQIATAVTVVAITAIHLQQISSWSEISRIWNGSRQVCFLGPNVDQVNLCRYTYAVGAISIILTVLIGLLQLLTCNLCGGGKYVDGIFTVLAGLWWLIAGFVLADSARRADNAGVPAGDWRRAVVVLAWVSAGLFAALFLVHTSRMLASCCGKRRRNEDVEKALNPTPRAPSAAVEMGNEIRNRPYMVRWGVGGSAAQQQSHQLGGPNI